MADMVKNDEAKAKEIAEALLEMTGSAIMSGDFERFRKAFHLPHAMTTPGRKTVVETEAELAQMFADTCRKYRQMGVTDLVRYCEVARFRSAREISSTHVAHLLAGTRRLREPYPVFSVLKLRDDCWGLVSAEYHVQFMDPQDAAISRHVRRAERTTHAEN